MVKILCQKNNSSVFIFVILIAQLFEGAKFIHLIDSGKETLTAEDVAELKNTMHSFLFDVLGLKAENDTTEKDEKRLQDVVEILITMRNTARANKDFALSDKIRDQLLLAGIQLKDTKDKTIFTAK